MKVLVKGILNWLLKRERIKMYVIRFLREDLLKEVFAYPSLINNGYVHIERVIQILNARQLTQLLILDVGAAGGETCILFSNAFPQSRIYGFEPIEETFNRFKKAVTSYANISTYHTALGNEKTTTKINVLNRITSSSIFEADGSIIFNGENSFERRDQQTIQINQLDALIKPEDSVSLIKMDVQGFEMEVLKGATETLKRTHFVLLELQNHEIYKGAPKYFELDAFLRQNDFELFELIPSIRELDQIKEFDAIYMNRALQK